jgi:hypothetical protein
MTEIVPDKVAIMSDHETEILRRLMDGLVDAIADIQDDLFTTIKIGRPDADPALIMGIFISAIPQTAAKAVIEYLDQASGGRLSQDQIRKLMCYAAQNATDERHVNSPTSASTQ